MNLLLPKVQKIILKKIYQFPLVKYQNDIAYQEAVNQHQPNLPTILKDDLELVEKIHHEGVAITSLDALGITSNNPILQTAKHLASQIKPDINNIHNQYVIHASPQQIMQHPEIFLWGLEQRLLNITEHYLGLPVAYHGTFFRRDIANKLEQGSRRWHLDTEDRKVLKIIIYVNDVSENQGPFQYIPISFTENIVQSLKYTYGYISNQAMQEIISPDNYKSCIGSAGTVIFAGTGSIFHRGKPPEISDRFTIFFDYTSRRKRELFYINNTLPHQDLLLLSQNLKMRQKECLFWQDYLS
ncbi:2OG-Fe(II) oxygenase [Nostoc spongiaeforme FACHB-130]|uniref:2OG-Fe(II) oxygenase n=1 Tax=Nostoc spongiaeforme FACHB-130 TaxID=1357510 RepID=A0ABR8G3H7_9NOSO|nr:2OG-Fe(II) oxygenase [Nostoc spongiaeforme]MBD2597782.1 2OG-Fe(II) oxygenase [Nostoc spongiaeforme FACHB-130]